MKRVFFTYRTTEKPYGGVNSFNRALRACFERAPELGWRGTDVVEEADLLLLSAASFGPDASGRDALIKPRHLRNLRERRSAGHWKGWFTSGFRKAIPVVHRLDGLTSRYGRKKGGAAYDALQISLNQYASATVFQSRFCLDSFRDGFAKPADTIVFNGVDGDLFPAAPRAARTPGPLRFIGSSWSSNPVKGHAALATLSAIPGVEVAFIGRWPEGLDPGRVQQLPAAPQRDLVRHLHQADFFAHFATNDPSPNVVMEALAAGLPVMYLASGGTPELCDGNTFGVPVKNISATEIEAGVKKALSGRDALTLTVRQNRDRFLIERAAREYVAVFDRVVAASGGK